jgi:hypothetical protein
MSIDNSLDLVFTNFSCVNTFFADVGIVKTDPCHPLVIEIPLDLHNPTSYQEHSYHKYALRDYSLLFSFLSNYDWSCVYSNNTADAAVEFYLCYSSNYGISNSLLCH